MKPVLMNAMGDQFGNYLCQKIIEVADPTTLSQFVKQILDNIGDISANQHGTRAVQTLVNILAMQVINDQKAGMVGAGKSHDTIV